MIRKDEDLVKLGKQAVMILLATILASTSRGWEKP
jgi:hypothetical protein